MAASSRYLRIDATLDVECSRWDQFAVAAIHTAAGTTIARTVGALVDELLTMQGSTIWAHCGGTYDFLAIAEELRRRQIACSIDLAGSRISRLVGGGVTLRDSWPLVPLALDRAAELAGLAAPVLDLPCACGRACGGYCAIEPHDPRPAVAAYCAEDARVLWHVLRRVRAIGVEMGLSMRGTLGSTAWATARDTLLLPDADLSPYDWRLVREGHYGGRVTIVRPRAERGHHWDLASAYPAALARTPVPTGAPITSGGRDAGALFDRGAPGIYAATVHVPPMLIPPLPVRIGARVAYPLGEIRGAWALPELRAAIDRGCEVRAVRWSITWPREEVLFAGLVARWYDARAAAGRGTALGDWIRLLANSLTGKFAEAPDRRAARMFPDTIKLCHRRAPCSDRRCVGACGAYEQLDTWGELWSVPFFRPAPSGHLQWAAYLTAATRGSWLAGAESQGERLVYGDTDSLWTTGQAPPPGMGDGLGEWSYKGAFEAWDCRAPRAYRYRDPLAGGVVRTAGMTLSDEDWSDGGASSSRGVLSFAEAARASRGLFRRASRSYRVPESTGWYGDRALDPSRGIAVPVEHGQIASHYGNRSPASAVP